MNSFLIDLGISFVLSAIKESFKNPESKAKLKRAFLKIHNQIKLLYADDSDFQ